MSMTTSSLLSLLKQFPNKTKLYSLSYNPSIGFVGEGNLGVLIGIAVKSLYQQDYDLFSQIKERDLISITFDLENKHFKEWQPPKDLYSKTTILLFVVHTIIYDSFTYPILILKPAD